MTTDFHDAIATNAPANASTFNTPLAQLDEAIGNIPGTQQNNLNASVAPTVDDDTTLGFSPGSFWIDRVADLAYICVDATDGAAVWLSIVSGLLVDTYNLSASAAPTVNDDVDLGYEPGSLWCDLTNDDAYICLDNTDGAAIWANISAAATGETNTASNVGTGGVGVFKQKTGVDLEFKKINAGSGKITITDDVANSEVDVDLGSVAIADLSDGGTALVDSDFSAGEGFMRKTGAGAYEAIKSNLGASTDPGSTDDSGAGYAVGSVWINTTLDKVWQCVDAAVSAAVWKDLSTDLDTGETNTASNVGAGGVGVFKQKSGVDFEFKKVNAGSAKITIVDDVGNNEVDIDLGSVAIADLSDGGTALVDGDFSAGEGFMRKTGAGAYEAIKSNLGATTDPGATDDSSAGYAVGSVWINVTLDKVWQCVDATASSAVWKDLSGAAGGGASTALDNLASVAVNTDIVSDTDGTDSLGSSAIKWLGGFFDKLIFGEAAAPATPAAGDVALYAKTDGLLYSKDDAGAETLVSGGAGGIAETLIDAKGDLIAGSAADTAARLAVGTNGDRLVADSAQSTGVKWKTEKVSINFVIDGGGVVISTGEKGFLQVPFAGTISAVRLLADQTGSITVDIWKDTYANYPPTNADTITGGNEPAISSGVKDEDTTLTSWTTSISAGDILGFNVDSVTSITRCTLVLEINKGA